MTCSNNTKPIDGSSDPITLTTTPQDLATMLGTALPTNAKRAVIHFDLAIAGQPSPLGRMSRDINFILSATEGEPIFQAIPKVLTHEQIDDLFRSVSGTVNAFVEFFDIET